MNKAEPFSGRLTAGERPALLLVDMVAAYLEPASMLYCETASDALQAAVTMLADARANGVPVILTNVVYQPGGADGGLFYQKVPALRSFDAGSPLGEFPPELALRDEEKLVTKQYPSAFFETGLADWLRERSIDTLVIGGYSTSGCIRATALDALQSGFAPFVVRDACADREAATHEGNLRDLQWKYAEVIDLAEARAILASTGAAAS